MDRTTHKATWWLRAFLILLPAVLVALALAMVTYLKPPPRLLTDDQGIEIPEAQAAARFMVWEKARNLGDAISTPGQESGPAANPIADELYFARQETDQPSQLYVTYYRDEQWTAPIPVNAINSRHNERSPQLSPDGQWLLFCSDRPGGLGGYDLYVAKRMLAGWSAPFNLGKAVNSPADEIDPAISPDSRRLVFASNRFAASAVDDKTKVSSTPFVNEDFDLFTALLTGHSDNDQTPWKINTPQPLVDQNSEQFDGGPCFSQDGDFLYFASNRSGGYGGLDLYRCRLLGQRLQTPENLGSRVNTRDHETDPLTLQRGFDLLFSSDRHAQNQPLSDQTISFDLYRIELVEVFPRIIEQPSPLTQWYWWALAAGLSLLVAVAIYIYEGGYRHLDLLKKCLLISLMLHVVITLWFSMIKVSEEIIEIVAPDSGLVNAVNLDVARDLQVKVQTRQTLTDIPVKVPQVNPTSRQRMVATPTPQVEIYQSDLPQVQINPGQMQVHQAVSPLPEYAKSVEAVTLNQWDFIAATPKPTEKLPQPLHTNNPADQPPEMAAQPLSEPKLDIPDVQSAPEVQPADIEPSQPAQLALLESQTAKLPPAEQFIEHSQPNALRIDQQVIEIRPATDERKVYDESAQLPQVAEPRSPVMAVSSTYIDKPPQVQTTTAPSTTPLEKQFLEAQAITPRLDVPADQTDIALPDSVVGARLEMPQLAQVRQQEKPRMSPQPVRSPQPYQPLDQSEQVQAAQEVKSPDLKLLRPVRLEEMKLPEIFQEMEAVKIEPSLVFEHAYALLHATPLVAKLDPGKLASPPSLFQRSFIQRERLVEVMGGTPVSEDAVGRALEYLARVQEQDGRWTDVRDQGKPTGAGRGTMDMALTALSALCFLASNHTPDKPGQYRQTIGKALDYLVERQKTNGDLSDWPEGTLYKGMYSHAIATIALAEAAIMSNDPKYRKAALLAAEFTIKAQNRETGGWRYHPNQFGDTSVFGWQVMALHSCRQIGYEVPPHVDEGAQRWLVLVSDKQYGVFSCYQPGKEYSRTMTAEAVFSRVLLGEEISEPRRAKVTAYLLGQLAGQGDVVNYYYFYYGSLCMMQLGGNEWWQWNNAMRDWLVKTQEKVDPLAGSWEFRQTEHGQTGGRVYTTAMATLTLQVYYRYLPMYKHGLHHR